MPFRYLNRMKTSAPMLRRAAVLSSIPSSLTPNFSHAHCVSRRPRFSSGLSSLWKPLRPLVSMYTRKIFIQVESTPNPDALKFLPNQRVLPDGHEPSFIEYLSPRATLAAPNPSVLASQIMNVEGVCGVFYGDDYITVTKQTESDWSHLKPEVFSLISEVITSGEQIVKTSQYGPTDVIQDSLRPTAEDGEVVSMIKELLETRIRPAIQEDGGDIEYKGFSNGHVKLKLRGACRTCDSSSVTLKSGIESMLMHYIEEVKGVTQVTDDEEESAMIEFNKFEEQLRRNKSSKSSDLL